MLNPSTEDPRARAMYAGAPLRGRLIDLHYQFVAGDLVLSCDSFPVRDDWLDVPFEAWKQWDYVQLLVRPAAGAPRAELVLSDLRGRFLRDAEGHPRPVVCVGTLSERLEFVGCGRGLSLQVAARVGGAVRIVRLFMGLTAQGSLPALGAHNLRPPPARIGRSR